MLGKGEMTVHMDKFFTSTGVINNFMGPGSYKGEFTDDMFNGFGEFRFKGETSKMYKGSFKGSRKHGKGVFVTENREEFAGNFVEDQMVGEFTVTDNSGMVKRALFEIGKPVQWLE